MTPTEQNIAAAESVGFTEIHSRTTAFEADLGINLLAKHPTKKQLGKSGWCVVPNYHSDLNAMHELSQTLSEAENIVFAETLFAITKGQVVDWGYYPGESDIEWDSIATVIDATAPQRLEACLRVKGLWKETA